MYIGISICLYPQFLLMSGLTPVPDTELLSPLEFPGKQEQLLFLRFLDQGWSSQKQSVIRNLELSVPPSPFSKEGKGPGN